MYDIYRVTLDKRGRLSGTALNFLIPCALIYALAYDFENEIESQGYDSDEDWLIVPSGADIASFGYVLIPD